MFSEDDFGPLTRLVLVNAIYFKGDWKQKFRKEYTQLMNFTNKDGSIVEIPMMKALLRTKYGNMRKYTFESMASITAKDTQYFIFSIPGYFSESSMSYQVLELPYKGDDFSLIIILPAEDVNIEEVEKLITAHQVLKWISEMQEEEVEISLPRLVTLFYYTGS
jgi:serine protease inhibitor